MHNTLYVKKMGWYWSFYFCRKCSTYSSGASIPIVPYIQYSIYLLFSLTTRTVLLYLMFFPPKIICFPFFIKIQDCALLGEKYMRILIFPSNDRSLHHIIEAQRSQYLFDLFYLNLGSLAWNPVPSHTEYITKPNSRITRMITKMQKTDTTRGQSWRRGTKCDCKTDWL